MSLMRITNCPTIASTACRIYEVLEGLETGTEQYDNPVYRPEDSNKEEVDEILAAAVEDELSRGVHKDELSCFRTEQDLSELVHKIDTLRRKLMEYETKKRFRDRLLRRRPQQYIGKSGEHIGLVVDGQSLIHALGPALRPAFLDLCLHVNTVLCCRMTPMQKASIIQMVQLGLKERGDKRTPVTAAVGDGGNDVAMIRQASVGIGLYGREGREAVRAADYATPQFR
ncbi:unnamed protein product [Echinostoma caproni]|uniref:PhoLip_ATPase_C domain-containing protein n=1 Tax=Echinostoma caproni TaxID=27848 RepID=A0A183AUS9_9TREM|nr:unnamed protein product [Echinostoma caproni]